MNLIEPCLGELSEGKKVACRAQDLERSSSKQTCSGMPVKAGTLDGGGSLSAAPGTVIVKTAEGGC